MSPMKPWMMLISVVSVALLIALAVLFIAEDDFRTSETARAGLSSGWVLEASGAEQEQDGSGRSVEAGAILVPLDGVRETDMLLDVSQNSSTHIAGSMVIPYTDFELRPGVLKTVPEVSGILGDAGISRDDSVVVYGECLPCGGGPSAATYVYWILKSLGHERVRILNGTAEDWEASGGNTSKDIRLLPAKIYKPEETADFTATYDYVKSGQAQLVDARISREFEAGSIPGSINMPYDNVLNGKSLKGEDQLKEVFPMLEKDQPVVVYTNTGMKASVVWFALEMLGYDARLYSYENWMANQEHTDDARN